jgi:NADH:ubiquinone oxidoreductase subunit 4 (subunit M)
VFFYGPLTDSQVRTAQDLRPRELLATLVFLLRVLAFGLSPGQVVAMIQARADAWFLRLH